VDLQEAQRRLDELKAELDRSLVTLDREDAGRHGELSYLDNHPADVADELSDGDRQAAVMEVAVRQRAEVEAALQRVADGTYGRCVDCGRELSEERLEARPEAARCVEDQQRHEASAEVL
jgi:DnaK suppressor protein